MSKELPLIAQPASTLAALGWLHLDGDGVCLNFSEGYLNFLWQSRNIKALHHDPANFDFTDVLPQLDKPWQYIPEFINECDQFSDIPAYPEAKQALHALSQAGVPLTMITACGNSVNTQRNRLNTLSREFGDVFKEVVFLPMGEDKTATLRAQPEGRFVDDQLHVCAQGQLANKESYLFTRPYNRNACAATLKAQNIQRLDCWSHLPYFVQTRNPE